MSYHNARPSARRPKQMLQLKHPPRTLRRPTRRTPNPPPERKTGPDWNSGPAMLCVKPSDQRKQTMTSSSNTSSAVREPTRWAQQPLAVRYLMRRLQIPAPTAALIAEMAGLGDLGERAR